MTGAEFRLKRKINNFSREDVSKILGVSIDTIHRIENNKGEIDRRTELAFLYLIDNQ